MKGGREERWRVDLDCVQGLRLGASSGSHRWQDGRHLHPLSKISLCRCLVQCVFVTYVRMP